MSDWLTGIIVLLIIVILADGFRRTYSARQNRLGVSPTLNKRAKEPSSDEPPEIFGSELPNGGARVIGHRDSESSARESTVRVKERKPSSKELREQRRREDSSKRVPEQTRLNLEKSVPILMDSVESQPSAKEAHLQDRIEPTFSANVAASDNHDEHTVTAHDDDYEDEHYDENDSDDYEDEDEDYQDEDFEEDYEEDELEDTAGAQIQPEEVFIINVMAFKGEFFNGNDLLDATLKCGLRYGDMDIFHRYSNIKGDGTLLFSMANMVKPGTFDLDAMDTFETPGVSLFMTLPIEADSMKSYELMVDTANALAEALDGELKDEQRSAMTRQTIEHGRQRISDFERKKLFRRPR